MRKKMKFSDHILGLHQLYLANMHNMTDDDEYALKMANYLLWIHFKVNTQIIRSAFLHSDSDNKKLVDCLYDILKTNSDCENVLAEVLELNDIEKDLEFGEGLLKKLGLIK